MTTHPKETPATSKQRHPLNCRCIPVCVCKSTSGSADQAVRDKLLRDAKIRRGYELAAEEIAVLKKANSNNEFMRQHYFKACEELRQRVAEMEGALEKIRQSYTKWQFCEFTNEGFLAEMGKILSDNVLNHSRSGEKS